MEIYSAESIMIDRRQTLRFLGCHSGEPSPRDVALIDVCEKELEDKLRFRAVSERFRIGFFDEDGIDLGFARVNSRTLRKNLDGCEGIIVFASTVGIYPDRLIRKYSSLDPARAAVIQAVSASVEECWCDEVNARITAAAESEGYATRNRYSPGYGDLQLTLQRDIFSALSLEKRLGLTLTDGCLMMPSKSVTAIIGYYRKDGQCKRLS